MANERLFYDVWLIEPNLVYREVPFMVVSGWATEGRVIADDKVRPSGQANWHLLGEVPLLVPFLLKPRPHPVEEPARPVAYASGTDKRIPAGPLDDDLDLEMPRAKGRAAEDDDPDMIPLIDISLVLLIFFLMTGKSLTGVSTAETQTSPEVKSILRTGSKLPRAKYAELIERPDVVSVAIGQDLDNNYIYFIADNYKNPLELKDVFSTLKKAILDRDLKPKDVTILLRADEKVPFETVQALTIGLEVLECAEIFAVTIEDSPGGK